MKRISLSTVFVFVIGILALGSIVYAQVAVKNNGVQFGVASALNQNNGINWTSDGFTLTINGVNWQSVNGLQISAINWTNANINTQGINWQSVRQGVPNNGSGTNWQAFGV